MIKFSQRTMHTTRGTSLIELVVYISILTIITLFTTYAIVRMGVVFTRVRTERKVSIAAENAMERIMREIELAKSVSFISQTVLKLNSFKTFSAKPADAVTKKISISDTQILYDEDDDGGPAAPISLIPNDVQAASFVFRQMGDPSQGRSYSQAIRIELQLQSGVGVNLIRNNYYATAILKNSY